MVKNSEIEFEFKLFGEVWTVYKTLLPVKTGNDADYWEKAIEAISGIMEKYPGQLAKDLSLAILGDLERRCKEKSLC